VLPRPAAGWRDSLLETTREASVIASQNFKLSATNEKDCFERLNSVVTFLQMLPHTAVQLKTISRFPCRFFQSTARFGSPHHCLVRGSSYPSSNFGAGRDISMCLRCPRWRRALLALCLFVLPSPILAGLPAPKAI